MCRLRENNTSKLWKFYFLFSFVNLPGIRSSAVVMQEERKRKKLKDENTIIGVVFVRR